MNKIVLASNNIHKIREFTKILNNKIYYLTKEQSPLDNFFGASNFLLNKSGNAILYWDLIV